MKKIIIALTMLSTVSTAWSADTSLKSSTLDIAKLPHKILLIEPEIYVKELSVGGVSEKVDDWSSQAKANVRKSLEQLISNKHLFDKMEVPDNLSADEGVSLEEHVALYDVVG